MRVDNIIMVQQVPNSHKSLKMYLPDRMRYEDMPEEILLRALCPKNLMKDWHVCQACMSGCQAGNLLVAYMTGERIRQQPVAEPEPAKKKPGPKACEAVKAKMAAARDAILQGRSHDEVAAEYGYSSWTTLKRGMYRVGLEPPLRQRGSKGYHNLEEYQRRLKAEALQRCTKLADLVRQGVPKKEAAAAVGYCDWEHAMRACVRQGVRV